MFFLGWVNRFGRDLPKKRFFYSFPTGNKWFTPYLKILREIKLLSAQKKYVIDIHVISHALPLFGKYHQVLPIICQPSRERHKCHFFNLNQFYIDYHHQIKSTQNVCHTFQSWSYICARATLLLKLTQVHGSCHFQSSFLPVFHHSVLKMFQPAKDQLELKYSSSVLKFPAW